MAPVYSIEKRAFVVRDAQTTSPAHSAKDNRVHRSTVYRNINKLHLHSNLKDRTRSGRPKKYADRLDDIEKIVRTNRRLNLKKVCTRGANRLNADIAAAHSDADEP